MGCVSSSIQQEFFGLQLEYLHKDVIITYSQDDREDLTYRYTNVDVVNYVHYNVLTLHGVYDYLIHFVNKRCVLLVRGDASILIEERNDKRVGTVAWYLMDNYDWLYFKLIRLQVPGLQGLLDNVKMLNHWRPAQHNITEMNVTSGTVKKNINKEFKVDLD
jgi:hypothetical protein